MSAPELLAPVGNREALAAVIAAGADAVYLGGTVFGMRLHRRDLLFDDDSLRGAIAYAHTRGVKVYVTVNNLVSEPELPELERYLLMLEAAQPDALIAQDFAVLEIIARRHLALTVHASVMMNARSEWGLRFLRERGVARVVASREVPLSTLRRWHSRTGMELECFVHGDMCVCESGQCYASALTFGQSGSRGRCLKPCRWPYQVVNERTGEVVDARWLNRLGVGDLCLCERLPELAEAGVASLKVEGRMRPAAFLGQLIGVYRRTLDRGAMSAEDARVLDGCRVRQQTTLFTFGQPTAADLSLDPQREPRIFSVAKPMARPAANPFPGDAARPKLAVRVNGLAAAKAALDGGADVVYVGGEAYAPTSPMCADELRAAIACAHTHHAQAVLATPRTTYDGRDDDWRQHVDLGFDGLLVGNHGSLLWAREHTALPLTLDFGLNLTNSAAVANVCRGANVAAITATPDMSLPEVLALAKVCPVPVLLIVDGALEAMLSDFAPSELTQRHDGGRYALRDESGELHPLRVDQYGRTHILAAGAGQRYTPPPRAHGLGWRLEAQDCTADEVAATTALYRRRLGPRDPLN